MELITVYGHLEALLRRLGVAVRCEVFDEKLFGDLTTKGGLCTLRGRTVVLVDARAPLVDRVWVLADALSVFDVETLFMAPRIRELIALRRMRNGFTGQPMDLSDWLQHLPHFPKEPHNTVKQRAKRSKAAEPREAKGKGKKPKNEGQKG